MGGHGGLNILPQKSWNVYNYEARRKVAENEAAAAAEAAAAGRAARSAATGDNVRRMRERAAAAGGGAGPAADDRPGDAAGDALAVAPSNNAPLRRFSLFAEEERAAGNDEAAAEAKRAEERAVARIMPDLALSRSCGERQPWYARPVASPVPAPTDVGSSVSRPISRQPFDLETGARGRLSEGQSQRLGGNGGSGGGGCGSSVAGGGGASSGIGGGISGVLAGAMAAGTLLLAAPRADAGERRGDTTAGGGADDARTGEGCSSDSEESNVGTPGHVKRGRDRSSGGRKCEREPTQELGKRERRVDAARGDGAPKHRHGEPKHARRDHSAKLHKRKKRKREHSSEGGSREEERRQKRPMESDAGGGGGTRALQARPQEIPQGSVSVGGRGVGGPAAGGLATLRAARQAREAAERRRAEGVVRAVR